VWNEPDPHQSFWQGSVAQYVALLKAAYPALKAGDPAATVVLGGPSSNDHVWVRDVYAAGAKGSFDALATHPYQGIADQPPEAPTDGNRWWFTNLPAVRKVMSDYGDDRPIWFTEMGWSAHANWSGVQNWQRGVTDAQQGDFLVRSIQYTQANYSYVPVMFWYKERKDPAGTNVHLEGYALLNGDLSERPVYGALKAFLTR
jgi:polysaccharide biosynthesis protein PslG